MTEYVLCALALMQTGALVGVIVVQARANWDVTNKLAALADHRLIRPLMQRSGGPVIDPRMLRRVHGDEPASQPASQQQQQPVWSEEHLDPEMRAEIEPNQ